MEYKKVYTREELQNLKAWFDEHMDKLPESLQLNKATYIPDLKYTVNLYFDIMKELGEIPCYGGQIRHLFLMKEVLESQWNKTEVE